jgi:hypothetical protein
MSKETEYGANMLLITTYWGQNKTFKLMPINKECPYMEVLYDPTVQMLVALSKTMKQNYEMLPKLDDDGEMVKAKKARMSGKKFKEERRLMDVPQEFYMVERKEQEAFIEKFAVNAKDYDYKSYLDIKPADQSEILQNHEAGQILDAKGNAMSVAK